MQCHATQRTQGRRSVAAPVGFRRRDNRGGAPSPPRSGFGNNDTSPSPPRSGFVNNDASPSPPPVEVRQQRHIPVAPPRSGFRPQRRISVAAPVGFRPQQHIPVAPPRTGSVHNDISPSRHPGAGSVHNDTSPSPPRLRFRQQRPPPSPPRCGVRQHHCVPSPHLPDISTPLNSFAFDDCPTVLPTPRQLIASGIARCPAHIHSSRDGESA